MCNVRCKTCDMRSIEMGPAPLGGGSMSHLPLALWWPVRLEPKRISRAAGPGPAHWDLSGPRDCCIYAFSAAGFPFWASSRKRRCTCRVVTRLRALCGDGGMGVRAGCLAGSWAVLVGLCGLQPRYSKASYRDDMQTQTNARSYELGNVINDIRSQTHEAGHL